MALSMSSLPLSKERTLKWLGQCLVEIASPVPASQADRERHAKLVAREYARNSKAQNMAQLDMFKHTMGA